MQTPLHDSLSTANSCGILFIIGSCAYAPNNYASVGGAQRHTVVVVCVCKCVIPRDSCSPISAIAEN